PAFDLFKGFIEFQYSFGSQRFGSGIKTRAKLPHPQWFIGYNGEETTRASTFIVAEHEVKKPIELTGEKISILCDKSSFLRNIPTNKSINSLIADALRLYSQALDERFRSGCFLGLWQTLETIALSKEVNGDTDKICNRIAWHGKRFDLPGSGIKYRLRQLARKRNDLVHRGIRDILDNDINTLKIIAEVSIGWLQNKRDNLSTERHLNTYYQYRTVSTTDINGVQETLEFISDSR